jgi:hypothetical protein
MHLRRIMIAATVALGIGTLAAPPARASTQLRERLDQLSSEILKVTTRQPVKIGEFARGTGVDQANTAVGIEEELRLALERASAGIIRKDANFTVQGRYSLVMREREGDDGQKIRMRVVRIETDIRNEEDESLLKLPLEAVFDGTSTIAELLQVSGSLPPEGTKEERNRMIDEMAKTPDEVVDGPNQTLIRGSKTSPFAVEILVRPNLQTAALPRRATLHEGLAFVDIAKTELYEIRVHNPTDKPIAAALAVDGLDVFHFSTERNDKGNPAYTHFIVEGKTTGSVVGWFQKLNPPDNYLSFLVTDIGKGAISQTGMKSRGKVGVIHVQLSNCRPLAEGARPKGGSETGFGPPQSIQQKAVRYEIDPPHEYVSVRYSR